jgi:1-acyl-sn-glycerol-3-phosphate acyltransferase
MMGFTPLEALAVVVRQPWLATRVRVRQWGRLPFRRGPALLIANHQHEDESEIVVARAYAQGPWRRPVFTASSRRLYEPGFFAVRKPRLAPFTRELNAGPLFMALGMLPLENELSARPLASLAYGVRRAHGDLALADVFRAEAFALAPGARRLSDLQRGEFFAAGRARTRVALLREPYRSEAVAAQRAEVEADIARIAAVVQSGATFFVTPEGFYSTDGRMRPLKGIVSRLVPLADVYFAAIAFDPFRGRRLSLLYRVVPPANRDDLAASLALARPVTTSALLASWLAAKTGESFTRDMAIEGVLRARAALPRRLFVDPEFDAAREAALDEALALLAARGTLLRAGERYRLGKMLTDARFPETPDVIAYQATFLAETVAAARKLDVAGTPQPTALPR